MLPQTNSYFAIPRIPSKRKREFKEILGAVAEHYKVSPDILLSRSRKEPFVFYKQVFHYLLRELTNLSLESIGKEVGGYDHSNIYHSFRKINDFMDIYPSVKNDIMILKQKLG